MGAEEAEEEMQHSLIMYDGHKGAVWAAGVRAKGVSEAIVKYVKDILDQPGYEGEKLTFKTDQEQPRAPYPPPLKILQLYPCVPGKLYTESTESTV